MKTSLLVLLGMTGALLLSTAVQADAAGSTITSGQLLEKSHLQLADSDGGLSTGNGASQGNQVRGMQDGSYTGTAVQNMRQTRTQEHKRVHNGEPAYQGGGSGSRYGQGYESRAGKGGYGSGGVDHAGGQGGGRR